MARLQLCMLKQYATAGLHLSKSAKIHVVHLSHLSFPNQVHGFAQTHLFSDVHM